MPGGVLFEAPDESQRLPVPEVFGFEEVDPIVKVPSVRIARKVAVRIGSCACHVISIVRFYVGYVSVPHPVVKKRFKLCETRQIVAICR